MGRNGMDNDAPASDDVRPVDGCERAARGEGPCPVGGAVDFRAASRQVASRRRTRVGRPTRWSPVLGAQLVEAVRETGWIRPAAARCGIPESVAREWIQRGKGEHPTRGATREYVAFAADIARAQGEWEAHQLAVLDEAASKKPESWGAAAWKLERFDREQYGRREQVDMSGSLTLVQLRALTVGIVELIDRYVRYSAS
jgi:hypothetical protein